jgi:hypothetical protein
MKKVISLFILLFLIDCAKQGNKPYILIKGRCKMKTKILRVDNIIKLILLSLIVFCFSSQVLAITEITVIGKGTSKEAAISDALRSAVERVTGVFVYSVTDVENFKVVKDKIVAASRGYVKDYNILEEKSYEGVIVLTVTVQVDDEPIKAILHQDLKAITYDDVLKDYALVTQKLERLRKSKELLEAISSTPIENTIEIVGYTIEDVGLNKITGYFTIKFIPNKSFWDTYRRVLSQISDESFHNAVVVPSGIKKVICFPMEDSPGNECFFICADQYYRIHEDLEKYLIRPESTDYYVYLPTKKKILAHGRVIYYENLAGDPSHFSSSEEENEEEKYCEDSEYGWRVCDVEMVSPGFWKSFYKYLEYLVPANNGIVFTLPFTLDSKEVDLIRDFSELGVTLNLNK